MTSCSIASSASITLSQARLFFLPDTPEHLQSFRYFLFIAGSCPQRWAQLLTVGVVVSLHGHLSFPWSSKALLCSHGKTCTQCPCSSQRPWVFSSFGGHVPRVALLDFLVPCCQASVWVLCFRAELRASIPFYGQCVFRWPVQTGGRLTGSGRAPAGS